MTKAYFVCHIGPNFQIYLIYAFIGKSVVRAVDDSKLFLLAKTLFARPGLERRVPIPG
jgi:hypothetical protein